MHHLTNSPTVVGVFCSLATVHSQPQLSAGSHLGSGVFVRLEAHSAGPASAFFAW